MLPQPLRQFIVEFDASGVGIGVCPLPAVGGGLANPPSSLPVPSLLPGRSQLRCRQLGALGRTCRPDGVAALAGGGPTPDPHLDRSQELDLRAGRQEAGSPSGTLGLVLLPVQLHPYLPPGLQKRESRRPVPAIPVQRPPGQSHLGYHPPSCPGGRCGDLGG